MTFGAVPFGMDQLSVYVLTGTTPGSAVPVPIGRQLSIDTNEDTKELTGFNAVQASTTTSLSGDVTLEYGGTDLAVLAAITGATVASSGTTPNVIKTLDIGSSGVTRPYVMVIGRSLGDDGGDMWLKLWKVKFNIPSVTMQESEYGVMSLAGTAVRDANGKFFSILQHETVTTIAAS